jgi:hypothetical protein
MSMAIIGSRGGGSSGRQVYSVLVQYVRDKRSPTPKNETVSRVMSRNRAKDSKPEMALRRALWSASLRGYRLHYKRVPGRPNTLLRQETRIQYQRDI